MKGNVVMVELAGEERKRAIAEFERYEGEAARFIDELKRLIDGNAYDHIKGHIEAFYNAWEEHKGITLLLEDIQAALSKQDEAVKSALLPIWRDFVNEKIEGFPVVEECTVMEGLKQRLMLYKIGGVSYFGARKYIHTYFQCERESEHMNDSIAYMLGKENKEGFIKRFKNTTDEALLYPLLYQEALLELEEMRVSDKHKKRAKGHLERFMKEWENARKDEASEPQQVPQKRKGAPNKSNKDIRDCIQGEDKSIIERLKRLTLNTDGSRKRGNAFYLYIGVCVKEGYMFKPTYGQIKAEFGDVGSQSGYNKYMSNQNWTEAEHISVKNAIEAEI